jgi:hypothetical protein
MRWWILVWLLATLVTLVFLGAALAAMVSSMLQVGRAAQRFQDEVGGLAADISRGAARAGDRTQRVREPSDADRR